MTADGLIIAAGRAADIEGLGREEAGTALTDDGMIADRTPARRTLRRPADSALQPITLRTSGA